MEMAAFANCTGVTR
uniref:Uncharacterized protein n=1 Tax=Arundo donax TaxID=35708 RepID=A0A0A9C722_ARUDO